MDRFYAGFRTGAREGRISWPSLLLRFTSLFLFLESINTLKAFWRHALNPGLALMYVRGLVAGLIALATLLLLELRSSPEERRSALIPATFGIVIAAVALWCCLR